MICGVAICGILHLCLNDAVNTAGKQTRTLSPENAVFKDDSNPANEKLRDQQRDHDLVTACVRCHADEVRARRIRGGAITLYPGVWGAR